MGVAPLSRMTVVAPRSDYQEVLKRLSEFRDFHMVEDRSLKFDQVTEDLAVRSVRLLAQVDQVVKDLALPPNPGLIDMLFKGVKIPQTEYRASDWPDLLDRAERESEPIRNEVRSELSRHSQIVKDESEARGLSEAIRGYSNISADLSRLGTLKRLSVTITMTPKEGLEELRRSLPDSIFVPQQVNEVETMVLLASPSSDSGRIEKVLKTLDLKMFLIPAALPQSPSQAYAKLSDDLKRLNAERVDSEAKLAQLREKYTERLLAIRELVELSHSVLDETRMAGSMERFATISGYVPRRRQAEFETEFRDWMVYDEPVRSGQDGVPTLMGNKGPMTTFELITREQGTPGEHEVDPTPLITFVFPIFFGMMFGDLGHGIILAAFGYFLRARTTGNNRLWGNIFLTAGISAGVFGVIFGEFFGFSLPKLVSIPAAIEIVYRPLNGQATLDAQGISLVLVISILIGIAHMTTGLSLDVVQAIRAHETVELLVEKIPNLSMYLSGVGFGLAFIGAGFSFDVFKTSAPAPLVGIPNSTLGAISITVVLISMVVIATGRGIAILTGKIHGESAGSAFSNGGIEVFEKISQFLANTISYVRLGIMLLIHAALLLIVNQYTPLFNPVTAVPWVIFNILIIMFEALVVYIQDLRLHIYEFFTKFYRGSGSPFVRLFPERVRVRINWN